VHLLEIGPGPVSVEGVTLHRLHKNQEYRHVAAKLGYFWKGLQSRRVVRQVEPDILHAHYVSSAGLVARLSGFRPYAVTVHGSDLIDRSKTWIGRAILRRVLGRAALVNPVAAHMVPILERLGVSRDRILVLPFGIDLDKFPFRPRADLFKDGIRLICTRSLGSPVYDIPTMLRAVAEARRRGVPVTLSLPATGGLAPQMKDLAAQLGIAEAVAFGAGYRNDEVPALLAPHDVYVSASLWDGASISLMETMACGTFPLVSDIAANREWLEHEKNAFLFPTGDWQRLAELIVDLPARREFIRRALDSNRQKVEALADRRKNLATLCRAMESLVARKPLTEAGGEAR
jgi:glycosyltransferase involved in cell wall biosynthesis